MCTKYISMWNLKKKPYQLQGLSLSVKHDYFTGENGEDSSSSSEDWQDERDLRDWAKIQHRSLSMEDNKSTTTKSSEFGLIPHSAELHRPVSYTEIKQEKTDKIIKAGAMGTVER